jgi:hypothetical protein
MRGLLSRGLRMLLTAAVYLLITNASALAATPAGATFGPAPASQSSSFTTHALATNFLGSTPDPITMSPCPPGAVDPGDTICGHFEMQINSPGLLQTCVGFPAGDAGLNDIDVYLAGPDGVVVASSTTDANPECLSFAVTAVGAYELQLNPVFIEAPVACIDASTSTADCVVGSVTFLPGAKASANTADQPAGPEMEGNGRLADANQTEFEEALAQNEPKENKLHVKSKDHGPCSFKATSFDSVLVTGTLGADGKHGNGEAKASGSGLNYKQPVTWTLDVIDGGDGDGNGDSFTFSTSDGCSASGPLVKGNVEFEISK